MSEKEKADIGAVWVKTKGDIGEKYLSGTITIDGVDHKFVAWKNKYKNSDKHPDFIIYPSKPKEDRQAPTETTDIEPF